MAMAKEEHDFNTDLSQSISRGVTLIDFDAPWCVPCRAQKSIIAAVMKRYQGMVTATEINIDDHRDIALDLGIQSIPTIVIFKEGREVSRFIGLQAGEALEEALGAALA